MVVVVPHVKIIKAQAWQPEFDPQNQVKVGRELTSTSCPLTSDTGTAGVCYRQAHTQITNVIQSTI